MPASRVLAARLPQTRHGGHLSNGTSTIGALGLNITVGAQNLFNFAPLNYFQRPDERYIAGAFADYEISPAFKPYLEFMFMDDRTFAQIAPSGDFGNTLTINCDNPLISGSPFNAANVGNQFATICGNPDNLINGFLGAFPLASGAPFNPNPGAAPIDFFDSRGNTYNQAFFQLLRRNTEGARSATPAPSWRGGLVARRRRTSSRTTLLQYGRTNTLGLRDDSRFSLNLPQRGDVEATAYRSGRHCGSRSSAVRCSHSDPTSFRRSVVALRGRCGNYRTFGVIQGVLPIRSRTSRDGLLGDGLEDPVGRGWHRDQRGCRVSA